MDTVPVTAPSGWRVSAAEGARRLAGITAVGAMLGLVVGGVGGRLAMLVLARLNPEATGTTSDDGFRMGQFTGPNTLQLLLVTTVLGVFGAGVYALVRGLMVGPRWFQVLSIAGGPAVVVGAVLVHTNGVDFRLLGPPWLAIGLFVVIPGVYAGLLTLLAESWLAENGWPMRAPLALAIAPLALWLPVAPALAFLVIAWATREMLRRTPRAAMALDHPAVPWVARAGLTAIFVVGLVDLGKDAAELM